MSLTFGQFRSGTLPSRISVLRSTGLQSFDIIMILLKTLRRHFSKIVLRTPLELRHLEFSDPKLSVDQLRIFQENYENYTPTVPTIEKLNSIVREEPSLITDEYLKALRMWGYLLPSIKDVSNKIMLRKILSDDGLAYILFACYLYPHFIDSSQKTITIELKNRIKEKRVCSRQLIADLSLLSDLGLYNTDSNYQEFFSKISDALDKLGQIYINSIQKSSDIINQCYQAVFVLSRQIKVFKDPTKKLPQNRSSFIKKLCEIFMNNLIKQAEKSKINENSLITFRKLIQACSAGEGVQDNFPLPKGKHFFRKRPTDALLVDTVNIITNRIIRFLKIRSGNQDNFNNKISLCRIAVHFAVYPGVNENNFLIEAMTSFVDTTLQEILADLKAQTQQTPDQIHKAIVDYITLCDRLEVLDSNLVDSIMEKLS